MIYRVFLNGQNFLINFDGEIKKVGFYTTRFVEADSMEKAEENAIEVLRNDKFLASAVFNKQNDSPAVFVEKISIEENEITSNSGFSFYIEK